MYNIEILLRTSYLSVIITSYKTHSKSSGVKSLKRETEPNYHSSLMFIFYVTNIFYIANKFYITNAFYVTNIFYIANIFYILQIHFMLQILT
jgi:hypothetical protein